MNEAWDQWGDRAKRTDIDPPTELTIQRLPAGLPLDHDVKPDTRIGFIDTETTGPDPLHDEITELALIVVNVERRSGAIATIESIESWLNEPRIPISETVSEITGIRGGHGRGTPARHRYNQRTDGTLRMAHRTQRGI